MPIWKFKLLISAFVLIPSVIDLTTPAWAASVTLEAELGTAGADWSAPLSDAEPGTQYRTILSNGAGESPGTSARVLSFNVTFPGPGSYDVYARVRVGTGNGSDDSFFYAIGFGARSPTVAADWIRLNNLNVGGFTATNAVVAGTGSAGINVWKWVNLSEFANATSEAAVTFTVTSGNLNQIFQIGAREDGLDMDAFVFGTSDHTFTVAELDAGGPGIAPLVMPRDLVSGNLIQFNDNGTWSWYQDERAIVDPAGGMLLVGSDSSNDGVGGDPREGDVETTLFDLQSGLRQTYILHEGTNRPSVFYADDHNAPGLLVRPDGNYLAVYAGHNSERFSYWRIFDGSGWGPEGEFDWNNIPGGTDFNTTYSNPWYLAAEGRIYNFVRSRFRSPNLMISTNWGDTWSYGGLLTEPDQFIGYVNGYFKYWGNGIDRIDFVCTEAHPRDYTNSIYHGYISNNQSFKSDGALNDPDLSDTNAPNAAAFTLVFANGTIAGGFTNTRCWTIDVQSYAGGSVATIFKTRINDSQPASADPEHAFFYARWNGTNWTSTFLGRAGRKMYGSEEDYVGLGALHPNDPNTIYLSTPYDPRNNTNLVVREIFKGSTTNQGASWNWVPLTRNSVRDNFRPVVPAWDANHTALLWFRGTYTSAQSYDAAIVGLIERKSETPGPMTYVDASAANTTFTNGSPLVTTGPSSAPGAADGQWHERTGFGNGGSVFTSAETAGENAPMLKTHVALPDDGPFDVWVNFWGNPSADWRVRAGLSAGSMQLFRRLGAKQVESGEHNSSLVLTNAANCFLYQAYLGRVSNASVDVFVDDEPILTGTAGMLIGDTARAWYDGMSYAKVNPFRILNLAYDSLAKTVTLEWNSLAPQSSLGTPTYTVQRKNSLTDTNWTILATGLLSQGTTTTFTDNANPGAAAFYRVTIP